MSASAIGFPKRGLGDWASAVPSLNDSNSASPSVQIQKSRDRIFDLPGRADRPWENGIVTLHSPDLARSVRER